MSRFSLSQQGIGSPIIVGVVYGKFTVILTAEGSEPSTSTKSGLGGPTFFSGSPQEEFSRKNNKKWFRLLLAGVNPYNVRDL